MKRICLALVTLFCVSFCGSVEAVSLNVVNGDVREVLRSVARAEGLNIVLDDSVQGSVTVNLQDVSSDEAIRSIALARGLSVTRDSGTIIISAKSSADNGFSSVHVFPLKFAAPEDMLSAVQLMVNGRSSGNKSESKSDKKNTSDKAEAVRTSARLWVDTGTNSLLMYGTEEQARQAESLISRLDVPAPQISLEARIVSLEKQDANNLGVSWSWPDIGMKHFGDFELGMNVDALIKKGSAELLSRPNITTVQGREAVINIGGEVPVPSVSVTNSTTTTSIEYRQAGIILRYTPYVNEDGHITVKVHTEVSTPQYVEDMKAYKFQKRSADTMVRLQDGETMVIGGLIGNEEIKAVRKVPFLGDIPILGNFFRNHDNSKTESEIAIFLTAKLLT